MSVLSATTPQLIPVSVKYYPQSALFSRHGHIFLVPSSPYIIGADEKKHIIFSPFQSASVTESSNLIDYGLTVDGVDGFPQRIDGAVKAILWHGELTD